MTLRMYAEVKKFALEGVEVELSHQRIHAKDCADCEQKDTMIDEIGCTIHLSGDLTGEERERLLHIAKRCPVHRTLTENVKIRTAEA